VNCKAKRKHLLALTLESRSGNNINQEKKSNV
jgi:hypothetical protein